MRLFAVTGLGRVGIKGFTQGHRTVAGTLVFSSFDRGAFYRKFGSIKNEQIYKDMPDELPPFNIIMCFVNEFGDASFSALEGVTLLDSSRSYTIDNPVSMETYSYMAVREVPLQPFKQSSTSS